MKEEIQKQLSVGFISVVEYLEWLANVVPVPKKDVKVRVCVDFIDLNKASPKDDFPLPHIYLLVDSLQVIRCCLSWMGFQGITRFRWLQRIWRIHSLLLSRVLIVIGLCHLG